MPNTPYVVCNKHIEPLAEKFLVQVKKVKPHVLLGLSGVGGVFHEEASTFLAELLFINSEL